METIEIKAIEKEHGVRIINYGRMEVVDISGKIYQAESYRILKRVGDRDAHIDVDIDVALIDVASDGYAGMELVFHIKMLNDWIELQVGET